MKRRHSAFRTNWLAGTVIAMAAASVFAQNTQPTAKKPTTAPATQPEALAPSLRPGFRNSPFANRVLRINDILGPAIKSQREIFEPTEPADAGEWEEITTFAKDNFPNRWAQFEAVQKAKGNDAPVVLSLRDRITARYRTLVRVQQTLPNLYDAALRQGKLEDDAWAASIEARKKPKDQAVQKKLREKVAALVKDVLQERQDRLDALKQTIQDEQDRLENDQKNLDGLIDKQITRITGDRPAEVDLPPRWGGGPGGGGGGGGGGWGGGGFGGGRWEGPPRGERRRFDNPPPDQTPATQPNQ